MSNYLHNLVMRRCGMRESAQPRMASLFEPLPHTALTPVDARADSRPAQGLAHTVDGDERGAHRLSTEAGPLSPPQATHSSARSLLSPTGVPPSPYEIEQPSSPHIALNQPREKLINSTRAEDAGEPHDTRKPSQAPSDTEPSRERKQASVAQPFFEAETSRHERPAPPSLIPKDSSKAETAPQPDETIRVQERASIKSQAEGDERSATHAAARRQPQAEVKDGPGESSGPRATHEDAPPVVKEIVKERIIERELSRERPPALLQDEPSTIRDTTRVKPEMLIVRPRVSRHLEKGFPDALQSTRAAEPEQVVHVTIGRIEVRAVPPTAQSKAEQRSTSQPAQSLEEYLRKRARGGGGNR
jgi:hypothetical protein